MRTQILLIVSSILCLQAQAKSKYTDEDNPYEFGFTIDGQQHRHEKKDANGIIQGEFGFITADGIYHVTVYATDEDGNFKILSMKNVRVSGPLDQPGAQLPDTSQFGKGKPPPAISAPIAPAPNPLKIPSAPVTSRPNGQFTTQSTIKPACAGCGYVSTAKPINGDNKLQFQTQAILNPKPGTVVIGPKPNEPQAPFVSNNPNYYQPGGVQNNNNNNAPSVPGNNNQVGFPNSNQPVSNDNQNQFGSQLPNSNPNQFGSQFPNSNPNQSPNINQNPFGTPSISQPGNQPQGISGPGAGVNPLAVPNDPNYHNNNHIQQDSPAQINPEGIVNANPAPIAASFTDRPPAGISVSNGVINVPNNPPINIQDKYPNMVDGLPAGVSKDDVTDLLYKFNYTIGFHGHYEKGYKNGAKVGGYFVNDRDGVSRIVTYVADENGYRPKVKFIRLDLSSDLVPKEGTEKTFGLKNFEFIWYPIN